MAQNQAAYLDSTGSRLRVDKAPMPEPGPTDIIIRNRAVAVNPVDWKIQDYGFFVQKWPTILGTDVAGEIVSVGDQVKGFKTGDRVTAHLTSLATGKTEGAGYQLYTSAPSQTAAIIPSPISFSEASVIPLALDTAAVGLYTSASEGGMGLPFPSLKPVQDSGKTILVWGGSSSVGSMTVQLAVASGAKVVATASKHNFDFVKGCGASEVVDYKSPTVVQDIVSAIKSVGGTFVGCYDSISEQNQSYKDIIPVLKELGGGTLAVVLSAPENVPENVKVLGVHGIHDITHRIWREYITAALEKGELRCLPEVLVVGKGLESVQKGLDENKKGVSAKKVVVELE